MCFRYTSSYSTSLSIGDITNLATSSLVNAQIINFLSSSSEVISLSGTMFRIGILNYFTDSSEDHVMNYVPTLLRVGGYMQSSEITTNNGIAFFFDKQNIIIGEDSLSPSMPLLPTDCASPLSNIVCRSFKIK